MRKPPPDLKKGKARSTPQDLPPQKASRKKRYTSSKVNTSFDSHCRVCENAYSWEDQMVFTLCCEKPIGFGCLEKLSRERDNCLICAKSNNACTARASTPSELTPSEIPPYIYRFGQRPEQERSLQAKSRPHSLAPSGCDGAIEHSGHSVSAATSSTISAGLTSDDEADRSLPYGSEPSNPENLGGRDGHDGHTVPVGYQGPDIAKAREFVHDAFNRFMEAANMFDNLLTVDAKKSFVDQLAKDWGGKSMILHKRPRGSVKLIRFSVGDITT